MFKPCLIEAQLIYLARREESLGFAKAAIKTPLHLMEPVQFPGTSSQLTQKQEKMNTAKK